MKKNKKYGKKQDPHYAREAQKYENPIPSRELLLEHLKESDGPCKFEHIAAAMSIKEEEQLVALKRRLRAMERQGQVIFNRRGGYAPLDEVDLIPGRVMGHPDGFGFLIPDKGGDDVFLSNKQMRMLLHGDRAVVSVTGFDRRGRPEGAVIEVLERANEQVVGRYFKEDNVGFVVPDNKRIHQDILIPKDDSSDAKSGQIVVAVLLKQPDKHRQPIGKITEVMGDHMAPGMEIEVAIRAHDLPTVWPHEVDRQIADLSDQVNEEDKLGTQFPREDLRNMALVTIDGEDARDFDDAVYCERQGKGWRLLVAIADVSHYVQVDSPLDHEAVNRGTSVYFPDRVIPMLPEILSNGLCSLNPEVDRLCMVCELSLDGQGKVKKHRFFEGVMRSAARLTYTDMASIVIDNDNELRGKHKDIVSHLDDLYTLYGLFKKQRGVRGAIDFETNETQILFGENRKIENIVPRTRNDAHKLIEEFMVAANVAAANFLLENEIPALYRIHETPDTEKLNDTRTFLNELGVTLRGGDEVKAKDFAQCLSSIQDREDKHLIQTVLLRSMRLAVYHPENVGHFGLAFDAYTHFTSPIRRYPDLLVHRAIRHLVRFGTSDGFNYSQSDMRELGQSCSMNERRADEATRDAVSWLKCEYMMDKVGEEFDGVISAVTSFGLFIELDDIYVEGLVHVTNLKHDYYHFDPVGHCLKGEKSGRVYRLANRVRVQVVRVDLDEKKIDFELVGK